MYHSVTFIDASTGEMKNCWDDWGLIPDSRPAIAPPEAITKVVEIEGSTSGFLDLTDKMTSSPLFKSRTGDIKFIITRNDIATPATEYENWHTTYNIVASFLHNKRIKLVLEDDPSWYYIGRIAVSSFSTNKDYSKIEIKYTLEPYKYRTNFTGSDISGWKWDTINLDSPSTVVESLHNIVLAYDSTDGITNVIKTFTWSGMPCKPKFVLTHNSTAATKDEKVFRIRHYMSDGSAYSLDGECVLCPPVIASGTLFSNRSIILRPGRNRLTFARIKQSDDTDTSDWSISVGVTEGQL